MRSEARNACLAYLEHPLARLQMSDRVFGVRLSKRLDTQREFLPGQTVAASSMGCLLGLYRGQEKQPAKGREHAQYDFPLILESLPHVVAGAFYA